MLRIAVSLTTLGVGQSIDSGDRESRNVRGWQMHQAYLLQKGQFQLMAGKDHDINPNGRSVVGLVVHAPKWKVFAVAEI